MKKIDIEELVNEYIRPDKILDSEDIYLLKEKIMNLPQDDRNILLLYIDLGAYVRVGEILNCSSTFIGMKLKSIKEKLGIQKKTRK